MTSERLAVPLAELVERLDPPVLEGVSPDALPAGIACVVKFINPDGEAAISVGWSPLMPWTEALGLFTYAAQAVGTEIVEVAEE